MTALAQGAPAEAPLTETAPLLFENVWVFDGQQLLPPTNVVVENGKITSVADGVIFSAMEPGEFQFQLDDVEFRAE